MTVCYMFGCLTGKELTMIELQFPNKHGDDPQVSGK